MRGDISRDTFEPRNDFLRVLMQQGRVQLDADWNEQVAILLHYMQKLGRDLIGPYGGPKEGCGFEIIPGSLKIGAGYYYVDGILCESRGDATYYNQPNFPLDEDEDELTNYPYLFYLDVWERHVTYIERPHIREVALGGPDTATRTEVVWQVKCKQESELASTFSSVNTLDSVAPGNIDTKIHDVWNNIANEIRPQNRGQLKAKAREESPDEMCTPSTEALYSGLENQLYRVEIHRGGKAKSDGVGTKKAATFKWSRENGSVIFPISDQMENIFELEHLGRDDDLSLGVGDWVEVVDDDCVLRGDIRPLLKVIDIDHARMRVTLEENGDFDFDFDSAKHPLLRRWDQKQLKDLEYFDGAIVIKEGVDMWIPLEDGIKIQFEQGTADYCAGDYWLIPARTATGDVEWPRREGDPEFQPPDGIEHHYAPLAIVGEGDPVDCRRVITQLAQNV